MATGLYPTILKILQDAGRPMTNVEVLDHPDVKEFGVDSARVSDYLGNLWRRGEGDSNPRRHVKNQRLIDQSGLKAAHNQE